MVAINAFEPKAGPAESSGSKSDQKSVGSDFMSILLGTATAQAAAGSLTNQQQPNGQQSQGTDPGQLAAQLVASTANLVADPNAQATAAPGDPAGNPAVPATPATATAGSVPATPQAPAVSATPATPVIPVPPAPATASSGPAKTPDPQAVSITPDNSQPAVIQALKKLTTVSDTVKAMPEAATQDNAVSASLVANKLAPTGHDAPSGADLPTTDKAQKQLGIDPGSIAGAVAAQVAPASKSAGQAPAAPTTTAVVDLNPTGQIAVSTSTDDSPRNSLQFTDKARQMSATQPATSTADTAQAFSVQLKSQMDSGSVKPPDAAAATIQADPAIGEKVVQQIVQQVVLQTVGDKSVLTIHLSPPELGTLRLNVTSQSGALTTDIQSQNASVRSLLETHLPALREALSNAGIEVKGMTVSSGSDFSQFTQGRQQAWQSPGNHSVAAYAPSTEIEPTTEAATQPSATSTAGHNWLA